MNIRSECRKLTGYIPIPTAHEGPTWDLKTKRILIPLGDWTFLIHELCHWIVRAPQERLKDNLGLPLTHRAHITEQMWKEERMVCYLNSKYGISTSDVFTPSPDEELEAEKLLLLYPNIDRLMKEIRSTECIVLERECIPGHNKQVKPRTSHKPR